MSLNIRLDSGGECFLVIMANTSPGDNFPDVGSTQERHEYSLNPGTADRLRAELPGKLNFLISGQRHAICLDHTPAFYFLSGNVLSNSATLLLTK
jgi:hypothetical protein